MWLLNLNIFYRIQLDVYRAAKFYISIEVDLCKAVGDDVGMQPFRTPATELLESTNIEEEIERQIDIIAVQITNFTRNGEFISL